MARKGFGFLKRRAQDAGREVESGDHLEQCPCQTEALLHLKCFAEIEPKGAKKVTHRAKAILPQLKTAGVLPHKVQHLNHPGKIPGNSIDLTPPPQANTENRQMPLISFPLLSKPQEGWGTPSGSDHERRMGFSASQSAKNNPGPGDSWQRAEQDGVNPQVPSFLLVGTLSKAFREVLCRTASNLG